MIFTVLRVKVQQWEDEGISLSVGGQSEEGVEGDDVVEEEGHQDLEPERKNSLSEKKSSSSSPNQNGDANTAPTDVPGNNLISRKLSSDKFNEYICS